MMGQLKSRIARKIPYLNQALSERDYLRNERNQLQEEITKLNQLMPQCEDLKYECDQLRAEINELRQVLAERDELQSQLNQLYQQLGWLPGHFYSPIPSIEEVKARESEIFATPRSLPDIDLNEEDQLYFLSQIKSYYADQPFKADQSEGLRYFFNNPNYSYGEAITLFCTIRHLKPKKIIEIGSGYSSCVTLDTNELYFDNSINCTFIEPYPQLLKSLVKESDNTHINIVDKNLQDIDLSEFSTLAAGDILFIDSTHVSKCGSDVNYIFFQILPSLPSGVFIHFHDIPYPFEYPKEWVYEGRSWNETYLLRAFLQNNQTFKIQFFNSFMGHFYADEMANEMPMFMKNPGTSIWLKKN